MVCECLVEPPLFHLPPPPDLSLIWHLISDEKYEPPTDCEWSPFISISDVSSRIPLAPLTSHSLIIISLIAVLTLLSLCTLVICRIKRGRTRRAKTKSTSSDGILTAGDNVWTYNSMKNSCSGSAGMLVYKGTSHNAAYQNTPGTIRSFVPTSMEATSVRPCTAATLRLHPKENSAAYHTVGRYQTSPTEFYEEIPSDGYIGSYPYNTKCRSAVAIHPSPSFNHGTTSCRRPPPTCKPPPIPAPIISNEYTPNGSDEGSIDRELARIPVDSPPLPRWEENERQSGGEGRESGYGTAPSRQWKSPQGRMDDVSRTPGYVLSQAPNVHSMTYV
ncbi:hypothetical protein RB195_015885 [Necator americanus]